MATKDITQISKDEFLALPINEQMKYIDRNQLTGMVEKNKTQNQLETEYGSTVANEIMGLDLSDKDKLKYAKKYRSQNQNKMDSIFNQTYTSLQEGSGFYPIGDQESYTGPTADDFFELFSPILNDLNPYETKTFYKYYGDLQKFETDKYKDEVNIAKDIDAENKEFHEDVKEHFERIGNISGVNDDFQSVVWMTESFFPGDPGDQTGTNELIIQLQNILSDDLGVYANLDTGAYLNEQTGEYFLPQLNDIKKIESVLDQITKHPDFKIPSGGGSDAWMLSILGDEIDDNTKAAFVSGSDDKARAAWKKVVLNKILSSRKKLYGTIPLALVKNDEFNQLLKEDWNNQFKTEGNNPFQMYKVSE